MRVLYPVRLISAVQTLLWMVLLALPACAAWANRSEPPPVVAGWKETQQSGARAFYPADLKAGESALVLALPREPLRGELRAWFDAHAAALNGGKTADMSAVQETHGVLMATARIGGEYRFYAARSVNGQAYFFVYTANSDALFTRYVSVFTDILRALTEPGQPAAPAQTALPPGINPDGTPASTPTPHAPLHIGGTLQHGLYYCEQRSRNPQQTERNGDFLLELYSSGDFVLRQLRRTDAQGHWVRVSGERDVPLEETRAKNTGVRVPPALKGRYEYRGEGDDAGALRIAQGFYALWETKETPFRFHTDAAGQPYLVATGEGKPDGVQVVGWRIGDLADAPPPSTEEEENRFADSPESFLLPKASGKAPPAPQNAGGLEPGLYVHYDLTGITMLLQTQGSFLVTPYTIYHNEEFYVLPQGRCYEGIYKWGYDALDPARLKKDGEPLCPPYALAAGKLKIGGKSLAFVRGEDGGFTLDGKAYVRRMPARDTRLSGTFGWSTAYYGGNYPYANGYKVTLNPDGTFVDSRWRVGHLLQEDIPGAGTYALKGFTLSLNYGSRVERRTFWPGTKTSLYLDGEILTN